MKKLLTIGLAAAALAGGLAASSGAALAADWNHHGYDHGRYEQGRYDRDHWRGDHGDRRWNRGWGYHHEVCHTVWRYSPYYGHNVRTVRCY